MMTTMSFSKRTGALVAALLVVAPVGAYLLIQARTNQSRAQAENAARFAAAVQALNNAGKREEAQDILQKWTEIQPENAQAWRERGIATAAKGDLEGAQTALIKAIALAPHDSEAQLTLGGVYFAQKKFPQSEDAYRAALKLAPENPQAALSLARALLVQNKNQPEAETLAKQAVRTDSGAATAYFILSDALLQQGKGAEAKAAAIRGLALEPARANGYELLAEAKRLMGDTTGQRKASATATALRQFSLPASGARAIPAPIIVARGEALLESGKYNDALALFIQVAKNDLANAGALEGAGLSLLGLGAKASGSAYLTQALRNDPERVRARLALGTAAYENRQYVGAARHFTVATQVQPDNPIAWHGLGQALVAELLHEVEAEKALRRAVEIDPKEPTYLMDLAEAVKTNNKVSEAETLYRHALALAPNDPDTNGRFGAFLASLPPDPQKRAEATALMEKALKIAPGDLYCQYHLGRLLAEEEKYAQAIPLLEAATKNEESQTKDVWAALARAYRNLGQTKKLKAALAESDKIQKDSDRYARAVERLGANLTDPAARLEMARASVGHRQISRALAEYATYLRHAPGDVNVQRERDALVASLKAAGKYPDMAFYNNLAASVAAGEVK